jgi:DNA-binding transcriptional MerR regulator
MKAKTFRRIGEVARLTGLHPSTIRNLERRGLLNPVRDWSGQRRFSDQDLAQLLALVGVGRDAAP